MSVEMFEDTPVGFTINQARVLFSYVLSCPHYDQDDEGNLIRAQGETNLHKLARPVFEAINTYNDKKQRGVKIPSTLVANIKSGDTLAVALFETKSVYTDWVKEYFRLLRYMQVPSLIEPEFDT